MLTEQQQYEVSNCADDLELTGKDRVDFIEEASKITSDDWDQFYGELDKVSQKYL